MIVRSKPSDAAAHEDLIAAREEYCRSLGNVGASLFIATVSIAALIVLLALPYLPGFWLVAWLLLVVCVQGLRNLIQDRFTQASSGLPLELRLWCAAAASTLSGSAFGLAGFILPSLDLGSRSIATLLLLALPTAGISLSHGFPRSFRPFLLCIVVPVSLAWAYCGLSAQLTGHFRNEAQIFWSVAILILLHGKILWSYADRTWQVFFKSCEIRSRESAMNQQLRLALEEARSARMLIGQVERERIARDATENEKRRLLQDLHDGIGSELSGALVLARAYGPDDPHGTEIAHHLQRVIDNLKLSVDALRDDEGDIAAVLGMLRHRMERHFRAAGIDLKWRVDELPPPSGWSTLQIRNLQLLFYEAFTNLLTHAGASKARFTALVESGQRIAITLEDDGRGCDPGRLKKGTGIGNMRERAARLAGSLAISRGEGDFHGLCLRLEIPLGQTVDAPEMPE